MKTTSRIRHSLTKLSTALRGDRNRRRRLAKSYEPAAIEHLEKRELLAANISLAGGELKIQADPQGSRVTIIDYDPANQSRYVAGVQPILYVHVASDDGVQSLAFHKSSVLKIAFTGSLYSDTYNAQTGIGWYGTPIVQEIDGGFGNDQITTGLGNDVIRGGVGEDTIHAGGGNDTVDGGYGVDTIYGDSGHDVLRGGVGRDTLKGGTGNDWLYGERDRDTLYGESGDDHLFGGGDTDYLDGGDGIDGLYGGSDWDILFGGDGADRILVYTNDPDTDSVLSFNSRQDTRLYFTDAGAATRTWSDGTSTFFGAGKWSERDIEIVDSSLGAMAERTGNNILLRKADGTEMRLFRHSTTSNNYVAYNSGGFTYFADQNFTDDDWGRQVIFHEFGHNWDTAAELDVIGEGGVLDTNWLFRWESGWRNTKPSDAVMKYYNQAGDGTNWWYLKTKPFARNYGKDNPLEDWATSFAAYFMDETGRTFQTGSFSGAVPNTGAGAIPRKIEVIDDMLDKMQYVFGVNGVTYSSSSAAASSGISGNVSLEPVAELSHEDVGFAGNRVNNGGEQHRGASKDFAMMPTEFASKSSAATEAVFAQNNGRNVMVQERVLPLLRTSAISNSDASADVANRRLDALFADFDNLAERLTERAEAVHDLRAEFVRPVMKPVLA